MAFYVLSHFIVMVFSRDVVSRVMAFYVPSHFLVMSFSRDAVTDHEAFPPMSTHGCVTETRGVASVYHCEDIRKTFPGLLVTYHFFWKLKHTNTAFLEFF